MPIYEFRCEACGSAFEALVEAGAQPECPGCGAPRPARVYSPQAAPFRLVRSSAGARRQEQRNRAMRESTRAGFKQARARRRGDGDGDG